MRLIVAVCVIIVLNPVMSLAQKDSRLEGCVDPAVIAKILSEMQQKNSRQFSVEQFRAMWPNELVDAEIDPSGRRRSLRSDDRILKSHCQCCEVFMFNLRPEGGTSAMQLRAVTINYSARSRDKLVEMTKLFARALDMREADLKTAGNEMSQSYQWEKTHGNERRAYLIDLKFTRNEGLWQLYFHTAFHVVEP